MNRARALGFLVLLTGCAERSTMFTGVDVSSGVEVSLRPMSPDRDFSGHYRSPHLGELRLAQSGSALSGSYGYEADGRRVAGSLRGKVRANLAEVEWEEHEVVGPDHSRIAGSGFFLYDAPRDASRTDEFVTERRPARLFGRRRVATRLFPTPSDEHYRWLSVSERDEIWTAVEVVPKGSPP